MSRRIILITNELPHHRYWVHELEAVSQVVGVVWVRPKKEQGRVRRGVRQRGPLWLGLKLMDSIYQRLVPHSFSRQLTQAQERYFGTFRNYSPSAPRYVSTDVNDQATLEFITDQNPELICFLGGDIARKDFFEKVGCPVLNFHSGLSPLYNGSGTTFQAVANGRPNFCGGTLMRMNEKIDGGAVLGYFLPEIVENDRASDLFCKGIQGAAKLYSAFLNQWSGDQIHGLEQERSLLYYRSNDWTIARDLDLAEFERSGKMNRYVRREDLWLIDTGATWEQVLCGLMAKLLEKGKKE